jgi:O-antigen ligase
VLISGLWSEDMRYFSERVRIRLPFLIMPLAFAWLFPISKKVYHTTFYFLIALLSFTMIGVLIHYAQDFEAINESLLRGKNIPVPMNHIRFSLLLAFSTIVGFLLWKNENFNFSWKKNMLLASVVFLFVSLHVLAVRSGIACFYLTVIILGVRYIFLSKKYFLIIALVGFSLGLPTLSYFLFPSIAKKVEYALFDLQQFRAGNGANYSDAERIGSIMAGLKVGNDSPIIGCGYGDLEKEVSKAYKEVFPQEKEPKIPHNQYIMTYAGLGIIGLMIFVFAYLFPIFYEKNYQEPIFLALNVITGFSFMVEGTIETQVGTAFYVYFLCLGLNYLNSKAE